MYENNLSPGHQSMGALDVFEEYIKKYGELMELDVYEKVIGDNACERSEAAVNRRYAYSERIAYLNLTSTDITVCDASDKQITIPQSALCNNEINNIFNRYSSHFRKQQQFRIIKTYTFKDLDTMSKIMLSLAKNNNKSVTEAELERALSDRLLELNKVHYNEQCYANNEIDILTVDVVTAVKLKAIREVGKKQLGGVGLVVYEGSVDPSYTYPDSIARAKSDHYQELIGTVDGLGYSAEIVDNKNYYSTRYINIAGMVHRVPVTVDDDRENGFYFLTSVNKVVTAQFFTMREAESTFIMGTSKEMAENLGCKEYLHENSKHRHEHRTLDLKYTTEVEKNNYEETKRQAGEAKAKSDAEASALRKQAELYKTIAVAVSAISAICLAVIKFKSNK